MIYRIFLFAAFVLFANIVHSQILRVDKSHLESDSSGFFDGNITANYSLDNRSISPTEKLVYTRLSMRSDLLYVAENTAFIFINSIEYYKSTNTTPFSTGYVHGRVNILRRRKVSYEFYGQIQYDEVRRMRLRELLGGGARITVLDKKNVDIHLGTGIMMEWEKWRAIESDPSSDIYKRIPKASSYLGVDFKISKNAELNLWGLNQIGYDSKSDLVRNRYAAEASLNIKITEKLTWTNRFNYFYDVRPIIPINQAYFQVANGLKFVF
jgi:hypothetical protein